MNQTLIQIDKQEILFSNLQLEQELCALHLFSFQHQIESPNGISLETYTNYYKENLGKKIAIYFNQVLYFEGIIHKITCINQYQNYINFQIEGNCLSSLLNQNPTCKSFYKKGIKDLMSHLIGSALPSELKPAKTEPLHYTVQYNSTNFSMLQLLTAKHGEWMYYDTNKLIVGKPSGASTPLEIQENGLYNLVLEVHTPSNLPNNKGYDVYKSELLHSKNEDKKEESSLWKIANSKRNKIDDKHLFHTRNHFSEAEIKKYQALKNGALNAKNVVLKCNTNNSIIKLGSIIDIQQNKKSEGKYIVTKIIHHAKEGSSYNNHIEALPEEIIYPPYTNPDLIEYCPPQYAHITNNEDKDGLSRVKVHFNWQADGEESPWINLMVPHAGADKGIRFLPEKEDEVLVQFIDNNADFPYVAGAIYSEKNKIGIDEVGNNIKSIRTKTNKRIDFDDSKGRIEIADDLAKDNGNALSFLKNDDAYQATLQTQKKGQQLVIEQKIDQGIKLAVLQDDKAVLQIEFDNNKETINIISNKNIEINAKENLIMNATEIKINASSKLVLDAKEINIESQKTGINAASECKIESTNSLSIAGLNTKVSANAQLEINGSAMAKLTGGVVMIN